MPDPAPPRPSRRFDKIPLAVLGLVLALLIAGFFWWQASQPGTTPGTSSTKTTQPSLASEKKRRIDDSLVAARYWRERGSTEMPVDTSQVYTYVEQMPQPAGGMEGLMQYLGKNIKYPALALRNQVKGKVFVSFVIGTEGHIRDVHVTKGIGGGCDEEAVRVIRQMPPWTPGRQNGQPVKVAYLLPINFKLK